MQSMRRFFCARTNLKAGHTIQILSVGADRCVRPRKRDNLEICDKYETHPVVVYVSLDGVNHTDVWF